MCAETRRVRIAAMLKENEMTISEIARCLKMSVKDVEEDLIHISRSKKFGTLVVLPARCKKCGFVFKPAVKIPKKCPRCKSTWIDEPVFKII